MKSRLGDFAQSTHASKTTFFANPCQLLRLVSAIPNRGRPLFARLLWEVSGAIAPERFGLLRRIAMNARLNKENVRCNANSVLGLWGWASLALALLLVSAGISGCGSSTLAPAVVLNFPAGTALGIDLNQSITINVTAQNDGGAGVTWGCTGAACTPLTNVTSTSVTFDANGVAGTATITATSKKQSNISKSVVVTVNPQLALPSTASIQAQLTGAPATVGSPYNFSFSVTGGTAPLTWTWSLTSATDDSLSLSSSGQISGTPGSAETLTFTVTVTDASAADASQTSGTLTLPVKSLVILSSITVSPAASTVAQGMPVTFTATGTYSDGTTQNISSSVTWSASPTTQVYMNPAGIAVTLASGTTQVTATSGTVTGSTSLTVGPPVSRYAYVASPSNDAISAFAVNSGATQTQLIPRGYSPTDDAQFTTGYSAGGIILEPTGRFGYVFNFSSNQIDQVTINSAGGLSSSTNPAVPADEFAGQPEYGIVDPTGRFLYVTVLNAGLLAFSIDGTTGALTALNGGAGYLPEAPLGYVITDRTGQFLYTSSPSGGVYAFSINGDGTLTALNNSNPYTTTGDVGDGSMAIDLSNNLYVLTTSSAISVWNIQSGGTLNPTNSNNPFTIPPTVTADFLAVDPSGMHIYVVDFRPPITTFPTVDVATLPLTASPVSLTIGPALAPGLSGADNMTDPVTPIAMEIDPAGNFMVVNASNPNIAFLLAIDSSNGNLALEAPVSTLTDGYSVAISFGLSAPVVSVSSIYAANEGDGTISTYTFSDGALSGILPAQQGVQGNYGLAADPFGQILYTISPNPAELATFQIAGASTKFTGPSATFPLTAAATGLVAEASGQYAYVSAAGKYYGYSYSSSTQSVQPISGAPFAGSISPTALATDPAGQFVFGLGNSGIDTMVIGTNGQVPGSLVHNSTLTVSGNFAAGAVDPSGQFLFALDNENEQIDVFYIYSNVFRDGFGTLQQVDTMPTGSSTMSSIAVDPLDRFIVVGDGSGTITVCPFVVSTGTLNAACQQVGIEGPGAIPIGQMAIDPTGSYLFVVQFGYPGGTPPTPGRVLPYSIAADGTVSPSSIPPMPPSVGAGMETFGLALGITTK